MKIKEANAGALTNFDVLDFLRSRGASKDPTRVIVAVAPSEFKVYDYLLESPACNQTKEQVNEFLTRCKSYKLAKAEVLNIINLRPSALVEIDPLFHRRELHYYMTTLVFQRTVYFEPKIIEESEKRFGEKLEELVNLVVEVLPEPPKKDIPAEENNEVKEDTAAGKSTDEDKKETTKLEQIDKDETKQHEDGEQMEVS